MSGVSVDNDWSLYGLRAVILENRLLRVVILPEVGARIYKLIYKPRDINLVWNHPRIKPAKVPFGARYDDVWCGGWDETLPNSDPSVINGEPFPDHGEVWSLPWDFETLDRGEQASVRFTCRTPISDLWVEKTVTLRSEEAKLRLSYVLRNDSGSSLPLLWNLHAAMAVSEDHRIEFAPMQVRLEPSSTGTLAGAPLRFSWPAAETSSGTVDLRRVPPASEKKLHFFYGSEMTEGWCGIVDSQSGLASGFAFDPAVFRACWLFGTFGGWRNLNVAVLEPSTGYPCKVDEAQRAGTCPTLRPGEEVRTSLVFSVAEATFGIRSIRPDGGILPAVD